MLDKDSREPHGHSVHRLSTRRRSSTNCCAAMFRVVTVLHLVPCTISLSLSVDYFYFYWNIVVIQFSSVAQLCQTLCDPMDCSTPGFPVHHHLLEFTQTHVHRVGDAIQPSHPLLSLLLPPSFIPSIRVFSNESVLRIRWPKYWSFSFSISPSNERPGLISFRMD